MSNKQIIYIVALVGACLVVSSTALAQDYDDDNYGNQGAAGQGDNDANYANGYGNEDGYNNNMPNYQQNVDSDGSNNNPSYNVQGGGDADGDYEGDDVNAAASSPNPTVVRVRRSIDEQKTVTSPVKLASEMIVASSEPRARVRRHSKYIGPVYTYVKTDKHAHFKWGVKHKVGKKHHG